MGQHRYIYRRSAIQSMQMRIDRDFALLIYFRTALTSTSEDNIKKRAIAKTSASISTIGAAHILPNKCIYTTAYLSIIHFISFHPHGKPTSDAPIFRKEKITHFIWVTFFISKYWRITSRLAVWSSICCRRTDERHTAANHG